MSLPVFIKAAANTPTFCWSARTVMRAGPVVEISGCKKTVLSAPLKDVFIDYSIESLSSDGCIISSYS